MIKDVDERMEQILKKEAELNKWRTEVDKDLEEIAVLRGIMSAIKKMGGIHEKV